MQATEIAVFVSLFGLGVGFFPLVFFSSVLPSFLFSFLSFSHAFLTNKPSKRQEYVMDILTSQHECNIDNLIRLF